MKTAAQWYQEYRDGVKSGDPDRLRAHDGSLFRAIQEDARAELLEKLAFLKEKGLTVGKMKTSDRPDPYWAYVIEPETELCCLRMVNQLVDLEIERNQAVNALRALRESRGADAYTAVREADKILARYPEID